MRKIPFDELPRLKLAYKDHPLRTRYVPDFICFNEIVVEIKAIGQCGRNEEAQIFNALKAAKKILGILINFGEESLFWKRFVYSKF